MSELVKHENQSLQILSNLGLQDDETVKKEFDSFQYESLLSQHIAGTPTPSEFIKEREGGGAGMLEYASEEYFINQLNKFYPGWWNEEMKYETDKPMRMAVVSGYLCVKYPTPKGVEVRKIWAVGAERIEYAKGTDDASQPDDRLAAARTRWLKLTSKWLGFGLDIYHQRVTDVLKSELESKLAPYGENGTTLREIASTITTGHGMRNFISSLMPIKLTTEFTKMIEKIPAETITKDGSQLRSKLWNTYSTLRYNTDENKEVASKFIAKVQTLTDKMKEQK